MSTLGGILIGLLILGLMMTLHELGHYLTGRKLGFKILRFQIFMGPKLITWHRNGIEYNICLLPIGAAVHFAGEYDALTETEQSDQAKHTEQSEQTHQSEASGHLYDDSDIGAESALNIKKQPIDDSDRSRWFQNMPIRHRAAVIVAGPLINILSGMIVFAIIFSIFGFAVPVISSVSSHTRFEAAGGQLGDHITHINHRPIRNELDLATAQLLSNPNEPMIVDVNRAGHSKQLVLDQKTEHRYLLGVTLSSDDEGRPVIAAIADGHVTPLKVGDRIVSIDGQTYSAQTVVNALKDSKGEPIHIVVQRGDHEETLSVKPIYKEVMMPLGFSVTLEHNILKAIPYSVQYSWSFVKSTFKALGHLIAGHLSPAESLSGPVGVVNMITNVVKERQASTVDKVVMLMRLFALISLSLGIMNLLPIPMLDGNQLLMLGLEAVRGKPLQLKTQMIVSIIGIVLLVALMLCSLYFDVMRLLHPMG